ncbi:hypothetical protein TRSC58_05374 [Trypanosoma rangeli SC58]|uniref:Uncharacterized protein n=1 Tax=Trypanosoma rangeli SC58 TaxID=429131 RepID=A0A061IW90_TRYRA|nr:hypothetical protein TRSC58_05374 [Trypanosoma rangeli SC58]
MGGWDIAHILEPHGDVYITSSPVVRHKVGSDGRELDFFPDGYDVQLVLTAKHLYKLRLRHPPPSSPSSLLSTRSEDNKRGREEEEEAQRQQKWRREETCNPPPPEMIWRESLGQIRAVIPLHNHPSRAWAAERSEAGVNCHGFAIEYFSTQNKGPKPSSQRTLLQRYIRDVQCRCVDDVFTDVKVTAPDGTPGGLRVREFHVGLARPRQSVKALYIPSEGSPFLEQEWCCVFREAQMNYWHERLEDSLSRGAK